MNTHQAAARAAFYAKASELSSKLTFNTREEYLAWAKQWKEDYKIALSGWKYEKFSRRLSQSILPEKISYYEKKVAASKLNEEQLARLEVIKTDYLKFMGHSLISLRWLSMYTVINHMYLIRKASKIRAGKKREERIAQEALVK